MMRGVDMIIEVDNDGFEAIKQLCDIALRQGGMNNLQGIQIVLNSVSLKNKDVMTEEAPTS